MRRDLEEVSFEALGRGFQAREEPVPQSQGESMGVGVWMGMDAVW